MRGILSDRNGLIAETTMPIRPMADKKEEETGKYLFKTMHSDLAQFQNSCAIYPKATLPSAKPNIAMT